MLLLQVTFGTTSLTQTSATNPLILIGAIVLITLLLFLIAFIAIKLIQRSLQKANAMNRSLERTTFLISVPKSGGKEDQGKDIKQLINVCEVIYTNLWGAKWDYKSSWYRFWYGYFMHIAFEIVHKDGLIYFYVNVPKGLDDFLEKQLLSQYPDANVEIVDDYNLFHPKSELFGGFLRLLKPIMYPIKTYQKLEVDTLNALLGSMSQLQEDETAIIQYVIKPASSSWQSQSLNFVSTLQRGKVQNVVNSSKGGIAGGLSSAVGMTKDAIIGSGETQPQHTDIPNLTPLEQELLKTVEEKAGNNGFKTNIRILATAQNKAKAKVIVDKLFNAFSQFQSSLSGQTFTFNASPNQVAQDVIFRTFKEKQSYILSPQELASLWHLPLPNSEIPNIYWLLAKKAPAPVNMPTDGIRLGVNQYRGIKTVVRIKRPDRRRHMYIIGRSGSGKTTIMLNMAVQDIQAGEGVCVVDPHGDLIEDILPHIPKERAEDVIIFNPADTARPMGLNMLEFKTEEQKDFVVQEMISIFYKLFGQEMIGPMFEHYMRNAMLALLEDDESGATLVEIPRMFTDEKFRKEKVAKVQNPVVKNFWVQEYEQSQKGSQAADMLSYVISKIGRFLTNDMMRNIVGQPKSGFDFRDVMDNQKILLVNLSKGVTGEVNSNLLGMIIVTKLQVAAMGRATMAKEDRKDFYLYIDEFQNFVTDSIATILSEARKYLLNLIIAHQYVGQLAEGGDSAIRDAVFGNVGSMIAYRIGVDDADTFAKEFAPTFNEFDVLNIPQYTGYVKLLIDNTGSAPFNMTGDPPPEGGDMKLAENIKQLSRYKNARDKRLVEMEIMERSQLGQSGSGPSTQTGRGSGL